MLIFVVILKSSVFRISTLKVVVLEISILPSKLHVGS